MRLWRSLMALLVITAPSCRTVESISINQIPVKADRHDVVRASGWSPVILAIPFGSGYVDDTRKEFTQQCRGGKIEGVITKFEMVNYFFGIYQTQNVSMEGYCVSPRRAAKRADASDAEPGDIL